MLVSIVTPVFNCKDYIEESILSVIAQKTGEVEYIIYDGGSTDGTCDIINKYKTKIDLFVSEPDTGQANALNKSIKRARGQYILWLNADDLLEKGMLAGLITELAKLDHQDVLVGNLVLFSNKGRYSISKPSLKKDFFNYILNDHRSNLINSTLYPKEHFEKNGYFMENFHFAFDYENYLRLAKNYSFIHYDTTIVRFRKHNNAKSTKNYFEFDREIYNIRKMYHGKLLSKNNLISAMRFFYCYLLLKPMTFLGINMDYALFYFYSGKADR